MVAGITRILKDSINYDASQLLPYLKHSDVRKSTLEPVLQRQVSRIPVRSILHLMHSAGARIQPVLFRLLEKKSDEQLTPHLVVLANHEDPWVRLQATKFLARCKGNTVINPLIDRLHDQNKRVRLAAVKCLHELNDMRSMPDLIRCLSDPDQQVRSATVDALRDIADTSTVPHLLDVLTDESEPARQAAVEVLNEVATVWDIEQLLRALRELDSDVQKRATATLAAWGDAKVANAVLGLLRDRNELVRRYATEILNTIPDKHTVPALIAAMRRPEAMTKTMPLLLNLRERGWKLKVAGLSHVGRVRRNNEDAYGIYAVENRADGLLVLADGMGGAVAGELASRLAVEVVRERFMNLDDVDVAEGLRDCVEMANLVIHQRSLVDPRLSGMGTTCVTACIQGNKATIAHVGDSRAYLVTGKGISRLTKDHNLAEVLVGASGHPHTPGDEHVLTRSLGGQSDVEVEMTSAALGPGSALVLCSDGLNNVVDDDEILDAVRNQDPGLACKQLVGTVLGRGAPDNVTIVIARVDASSHEGE